MTPFFRDAKPGLVLTVTLASGEQVRIVVNANRKAKGRKLKACSLRVGVEVPETAVIETTQFLGPDGDGAARMVAEKEEVRHA